MLSLNEPAKDSTPVQSKTEAENGLRAAVARQQQLQWKVILLSFVIAVPLLSLIELSISVRVVATSVVLLVMMGGWVTIAYRNQEELQAAYQQIVRDMEQERHDIEFRQKASAFHDRTTQLLNYEYFLTRLREEVERSRRYSRPLVVLLLDIMHFDEVNQRYGRETGNQVLRRFATLQLRSTVRSTDVVARFGGDEFIVLLPETDKLQAQTAVGHIREVAARGMALSHGERLALTLACGMVSFPEDGLTAEEVVQAAERALKAAKHTRDHASRAAGI